MGAKRKTKSGLYWHCWHQNQYPCQLCADYDARIKQIKENKPKCEQALRLKLFKKVKAKIGDKEAYADWQKACADWQRACADWQRACADWQRARADRQKADADRQKADADRQKACADWQRADADRQKADADFFNSIDPKELKALHDKECGCKYYEQNMNIFADGRD